DSNFQDLLLDIQPEMLLMAELDIGSIGYDKICRKILVRADQLSFKQRKDESLQINLHRLNSQETVQVIREYLQNPKSNKEAIELAIDIIEACQFSEFS